MTIVENDEMFKKQYCLNNQYYEDRINILLNISDNLKLFGNRTLCV